MLKKALRLKTMEDFERVFHKGKPLFFGAIACKITPNTLGHIRLGFSFGKKHVSAAVCRNRLRRVLSEPFSREEARSKRHPSYDVVFFSVKKVEGKQHEDFASVGESVVKCIYT